jgi:hypothetical protein
MAAVTNDYTSFIKAIETCPLTVLEARSSASVSLGKVKVLAWLCFLQRLGEELRSLA